LEFKIFAWVLFVCIVCPQLNAEAIRPGILHIVFDYQNSRKDSEGREQIRQTWVEVCPQFGDYFRIHKGLHQSGVFQSVQCSFGRENFDQIREKTDWYLAIQNTTSHFRAELYHRKIRQPLARTLLDRSLSRLKQLEDASFASILAFDLIHQLPFAWVVRAADVENNSFEFRTQKPTALDTKIPKFPRLVLYDLSLNEQTWRSRIRAAAWLRGNRYELSQSLPGSSRWLFAHSSLGPGTYSKPLKQMMYKLIRRGQRQDDLKEGSNAQQEDEESEILDLENEDTWNPRRYIPGGFLGIRYGNQFSSGYKPNKNPQYFGLLFEKRGGFLNGLRYYYDKIPKDKKSLTLSDGSVDYTFLDFARHTIGYSFSFQVHRLLPLLTVDPKVGLWTLNVRLPSRQDSAGAIQAVSEFTVGTTYSAALELGLEKHFSWGTLRGWHGRDIGYSPIESGSRIMSSRFGVDCYLPLITHFWGGLSLRGIGFYFSDTVTIQQGISSDPRSQRFLGYTTGFGGIGTALAW
jgi:hypothetical protein